MWRQKTNKKEGPDERQRFAASEGDMDEEMENIGGDRVKKKRMLVKKL